MNVLVVGATGRFAHLVVPELQQVGVHVYGLARSTSEAQPCGAGDIHHFRCGDLTDIDSLKRACKGMDGVFHLNPAFAPGEEQLGLNMVRAAEASGVRKFVFSGVIHPSISDMVNHAAKRPVEEALYGSKLTFTVLQPAMFMQTMAGGWADIRKKGVFALPYSVEQKACYVDYRDVAAAAAIAFVSDRLDYGTFELCSPGMFDRVEVAALMSAAANQVIRARAIPFASWAEQSHLPSGPVRDGLERMYAHYERVGFRGGNSLVLEAVLCRKPRTLAEYFQELASSIDFRS